MKTIKEDGLETVKKMGFSSLPEYFRLVSNADISTPEKQAAFLEWRDNDGTKDGLNKLQ